VSKILATPHCYAPGTAEFQPRRIEQRGSICPLGPFRPNLIHGERKQAIILQFLSKFRNPWSSFCSSSALSAFTGDVTSFFIISTIVLISVTLDFVQEYRAGQAADRLRQSVAVRGQVLREGKHLEIILAEMVPWT